MDDILKTALHAAADAADANYGKQVGDQYRKFADRKTNEQQLDQHDSEDAQAFEEAWNNWTLKDDLVLLPLNYDRLRTIAALWFNKGNARGCERSIDLVTRMLAK